MYAKKIYPVYVSKHKLNCEKQVTLLTIPIGEEWHYLAVITLSELLRGITSKDHRDFNCLNCLHAFATENKHEFDKKVHENKDFCNVVIPSADNKILKFSQHQKSYIILTYFEGLMEKFDGCKNNTENSSITKVVEHIHQLFQCLLYHHLKAQKISMMYTEVKIAGKSFVDT